MERALRGRIHSVPHEGRLAVSVGSRRGRPEILINADAAAAEGVLFSSELLKIATLVEGSPDEFEAPADPTVP